MDADALRNVEPRRQTDEQESPEAALRLYRTSLGGERASTREAAAKSASGVTF